MHHRCLISNMSFFLFFYNIIIYAAPITFKQILKFCTHFKYSSGVYIERLYRPEQKAQMAPYTGNF